MLISKQKKYNNDIFYFCNFLLEKKTKKKYWYTFKIKGINRKKN